MAVSGDSESPGGHRIDEVPLERRFCNQCSDEIRGDEDIGDLWWEPRAGEGTIAVVLCRDCA